MWNVRVASPKARRPSPPGPPPARPWRATPGDTNLPKVAFHTTHKSQQPCSPIRDRTQRARGKFVQHRRRAFWNTHGHRYNYALCMVKWLWKMARQRAPPPLALQETRSRATGTAVESRHTVGWEANEGRTDNHWDGPGARRRHPIDARNATCNEFNGKCGGTGSAAPPTTAVKPARQQRSKRQQTHNGTYKC